MEQDFDDEDEKCRVVTQVAVQKAMDACGTEEAVREQLKRFVGLPGTEGVDPDCDASLDRGLDVQTLANNRATRQWVFCRAWEQVAKEDKPLAEAVEVAWAEARQAGEDKNIEV